MALCYAILIFISKFQLVNELSEARIYIFCLNEFYWFVFNLASLTYQCWGWQTTYTNIFLTKFLLWNLSILVYFRKVCSVILEESNILILYRNRLRALITALRGPDWRFSRQSLPHRIIFQTTFSFVYLWNINNWH